MPPVPQYHLTIYLIKEGLALEQVIIDVNNLKHIGVQVEDRQFDLFVKEIFPHSPSWGEFFDGYVNRDDLGKASSPGAVLIVKAQERTYALTFGSGRFLLLPGSYEHRFGLRTVLNTIENVRSVDRRRFDAISSLSRTQAIRETNINEFGLDIERDLLRGIVGTPKDEFKELGSRMSGNHQLSVNVTTTVDKLIDLLPKYFEKSTAEDYKTTDFAFIDQIEAITEVALIDTLDEILIERINAKNFDDGDIELGVPEILEFSEIVGFRYTKTHSKSPRVNEISIRTYLDDKERRHLLPLSHDTLLNNCIWGVYANDESTRLWRVYDCIYAEIIYDGKTHILSDSTWYRIETEFKEQVESDIRDIDIYDGLPSYKDGCEGDYNERVCRENEDFVLFDKKFIHIGKRQKFEFCDVFSKDKDLIHVKRGETSAVLSHLFAQGLVSAECFLLMGECRQKVCDMLPEALKIDDIHARPNAKDYRVIYAIVKKGEMSLPFFSKVNLRYACQQLSLFGYRHAIAYIKPEEEWDRKLVYPEARRRGV